MIDKERLSKWKENVLPNNSAERFIKKDQDDGLDCPNFTCNNEGWYMYPDDNGDPWPTQCEWCYRTKNSKFNLKRDEQHI